MHAPRLLSGYSLRLSLPQIVVLVLLLVPGPLDELAEVVALRQAATVVHLGGLLPLRPILVAEDLPCFPDPDLLPLVPGLPEALRFLDGTEVKTAEEWRGRRRAELKALFQHYMYGYFPLTPGGLTASVERARDGALAGKARLKEVLVPLDPAGHVRARLLLVVPAASKGRAPVVLGLNFCGNHEVLDDPFISIPTSWMPSRCPGVADERATTQGRGQELVGWAIEASIDRGYAIATVYHGDIDPDRPVGRDGVQKEYRKGGADGAGGAEGAEGDDPHAWGTIAAWAWGLQRAVDYLVTDPDIDPGRIAVYGHSRNGKTALLAAAFDERIALCFPHQAGCGGTAPSRGKVGESVKQITERFPHWFNKTFARFGEQVDRLPIDQHELVALLAPRPVLFTNAEGDTWANPAGQFEVLRAASAVYKLLGTDGLAAESMPESGKVVGSTLGYWIRPGNHSVTGEDWKVFLDFADQHLGK